jgi:hypothetical protein
MSFGFVHMAIPIAQAVSISPVIDVAKKRSTRKSKTRTDRIEIVG